MEGSLTELFLGITAVSLLPHAIIGGVQKLAHQNGKSELSCTLPACTFKRRSKHKPVKPPRLP